MSVEQEYEDILQNIEAMVIGVYHEHPDLKDQSVSRVYDGLIRTYTREQKGRTPPPLKLTEVEQTIYDNVRHICEWRMGRANLADKTDVDLEDTEDAGDVEMEAVDMDVIIACLKRLDKSVKFWSDQAGKQGYVNYVSNFVG